MTSSDGKIVNNRLSFSLSFSLDMCPGALTSSRSWADSLSSLSAWSSCLGPIAILESNRYGHQVWQLLSITGLANPLPLISDRPSLFFLESLNRVPHLPIGCWAVITIKTAPETELTVHMYTKWADTTLWKTRTTKRKKNKKNKKKVLDVTTVTDGQLGTARLLYNIQIGSLHNNPDSIFNPPTIRDVRSRKKKRRIGFFSVPFSPLHCHCHLISWNISDVRIVYIYSAGHNPWKIKIWLRNEKKKKTTWLNLRQVSGYKRERELLKAIWKCSFMKKREEKK